MRKLINIVVIVLAFTTIICGVWMYSQETVETSSKIFHMIAGIATLLLSSVAIFLKR